MLNMLFLFWLYSLLFTWTNVVGTLSIDNILAPVLLVLYVFLRPHPDIRATNRRIRVVALILSVFAIIQVVLAIKLYNDTELWWQLSWGMLKYLGYVTLPVLYIRDTDMLNKANSVIVLMAVTTAVASVLGALGIVSYFAQYDDPLGTRIPGLLRARGFFAAVGDSALVFTYTLMLVFMARGKEFLFGFGHFFIRAMVVILILVGVIANQSRNIVLTLTISLLFYFFGRSALGRMSPVQRMTVLYVFAVVTGLMIVVIFFNFNAIFDAVVWSFGREAGNTVNVRLESYWYSLMLLKKDLLLGLSATDLNRELEFVMEVHNRWLSSALLYGLLGVAGIVALCWASVRGALIAVNNIFLRRHAIIIFVFMFSSWLFSSNFYGARSFLFWVLMGVTLSVQTLSTYKEEQAYMRMMQAKKEAEEGAEEEPEPPGPVGPYGRGRQLSSTDVFLGRYPGGNRA